MITAEELINSNWNGKGKGYTVKQLMIEFAKMHVQAALKEASELGTTYLDDSWNYVVREESILNAYPLHNIK